MTRLSPVPGVLGAVAVLLLAACGTGPTAATAGAESGVTATSVLIGTSNALTGPVASVCLPTSAGATAWFDYVNAKGGVHGRKITDTVLDDGYQAPRATANVRTLQSKGVFALFGGCGTVTAASIATMVRGTELPYLFPYAALFALVHPTQPNVYALLPLYSDQVRALVPYVAGRDGTGTVYSVTSQIPGYQDDVTGAQDGTRAAGDTLLDSALLPAANAPVQQAAVKASAAHSDYLVLTVLAPDAARMINAMAASGALPHKGILGVSVLASQSFADALAQPAASLLQTTSPTVPPGDPKAAECLAALRTYAPTTVPDAFALYGCAAAQTFVAALDRAGAHLTRTGLRQALDSMQGAIVSPLLPPVSFSQADHLGLHSMFLLRLSDGKFSSTGLLPVPAA